MSELDNYRRLWNGTESGWKVCQYKGSVWLVEYTFDASGPTDSEFASFVEFVSPFPNESQEHMRERLRTCFGCVIGSPIGRTHLKRLECSGLRVSLTEVRPDHHVILMPDGRHFLIEDPDVRERVAHEMMKAGTEIEIRDIN